MIPKGLRGRIKCPTMGFEPAIRRIKIDGIPEFTMICKLKQYKCRHECVGGHSANGDFGPDPARLLQGGEIGHSPLDSRSPAVLKGQRPDA